MSEALTQPTPAWQTEDLQDEWVELDEEDDSENDNNNLTYGGTRSISLTAPLATHIHTNSEYESDISPSTNSSQAAGTFLIREDIPKAPLLPKTPGRNKKGLIKDFFSPMPLERMFEPPSPPTSSTPTLSSNPHISSRLSQDHVGENENEDEILETDIPDMVSFDGRKASVACQFTFALPRERSLDPNRLNGGAFPQAQSTPNPPFVPNITAPPTDPRLRLFQFQYDTYTRDHLSAMVDSIAINTPSGTGSTPSPTSFGHGLSRVSEVTGSSSNISHLRSTKRVKLSPRSDFYGEGVGAGASIARPKIFGKDYVGESRSLMQQIKQARDFSTISTVVSSQHESPTNEEVHGAKTWDNHTIGTSDSARRPSFLRIPKNNNASSLSGTVNSNPSSYSASTYRQQAAALMAQIKSDMKGQKRLFSGETDFSHATSLLDDKGKSFTRSSSPEAVSTHISHVSNEDKEIQRHQSPRRRSSSTKSNISERSRQKPSPRKTQRRASATGEVDLNLVDGISKLAVGGRSSKARSSSLSQMPSTAPVHLPNPTRVPSFTISGHLAPPSALAPPSYPSSSIRLGANEDLNRFVSSSTASGTTLTAGSAPSFVKHAGPAHIRTIAPGDIPALPERLGDMLFDKVMMKWVKNTARATREDDDTGNYNPTDELSEDPFGDIESLRDDSRGQDAEVTHESIEGPEQALGEMSRIDEQSEIDDEEEMELTSFSTDGRSRVVNVMTGVDTDGMEDIDGDQTTDSEDEDEVDRRAVETSIHEIDFDSYDVSHHEPESRSPSSSPLPEEPLLVPAITPSSGTHHQLPSVQTPATPVVRSVLKSYSATPTSVLKGRNKYQTPLPKGHRRSVSFSDGKRDGPIRGLSMNTTTDGETDFAESATGEPSAASTSVVGNFVPSARSKRIADMMGALEKSGSDEHDSPSKGSSGGRLEEMQPLTHRRPRALDNGPSSSKGSISRRVFSRSHSNRPSSAGQSQTNLNATFLTECSFGVAHDRLVQVITDVQPFEPHWEELNSIDLSGKKLESVARLKEFLPRLDSLSLNSNELSWLSGVPGTVRTLSVASNSLTGMTSYSHLLNLENLDISRNDVESLRQLACLRHLRELKADGNKITSIDGLQHMDGLVKLSLQGNCIQSIDLAQYRWTRLEMLNISYNRLDSAYNLALLPSLIALNIDNNALKELDFDGPMPRLRILRVSGNRLHQLHVACVPNLRTLYADNNSLSALVKVDRLTKLENLSLRNQSGRGLNLLTRDVRDVKRLYLSGNPLKTGFLEEPCYNLVYLELAACRLTALPEELSVLVPNLRVLNLNYNFLEDARPLEGLTRLKKLTIIGSRLKGTKPLIRLLQRMPDVEMLDFRMNPCTLGWYLPLLVKDVPGALQPSEGHAEGGAGRATGYAWQELDCKFRRDLPDESYIGRLAYRGLIMRGCPRIRMLDGVEVSEKERAKAHHLLQGILGKGKKGKGKGVAVSQ